MIFPALKYISKNRVSSLIKILPTDNYSNVPSSPGDSGCERTFIKLSWPYDRVTSKLKGDDGASEAPSARLLRDHIQVAAWTETNHGSWAGSQAQRVSRGLGCVESRSFTSLENPVSEAAVSGQGHAPCKQ